MILNTLLTGALTLGALANPGGPGGSGYLMPFELIRAGLKVNDRYDLVGVDPRGVGYSTKAACAGLMPKEPPHVGPRLHRAADDREHRPRPRPDPRRAGRAETELPRRLVGHLAA